MKTKLLSFISCFTFIFTAICAETNETTIYLSQSEKSSEQAAGYFKTGQSLSRYLAYRDIPAFITQYCQGKNALDYGAGTGFSTQFLLEQELDVTGVDISKEMLVQATLNCPDTPFYLSQNGSIPSPSDAYDLVFSSLVLFELGSEKEILAYLEEAKRVLKKTGIFIAVTGSEEMYSKNWLIFNTDFPENVHLKSGDLAKIYLCDADIEFTDYYWREADYLRLFEEAGFQVLEVHHPMGKEEEPCLWKDEKTNSPFVIFVARKNSL